MGGSVSHVFRSGSALLLNGRNSHKISESSENKIRTIFDALVAKPKISIQTLEGLLSEIPKYENILQVQDEAGFNLLQRCVAVNHIDLVKWILTRHHLDVNRCACSLPLHIACLKGYEECVELLLKHGARIDAEARMCFPGPHHRSCELTGGYVLQHDFQRTHPNNKLQSAIHYSIDGDHINVLNILTQKLKEPWVLFRTKKPLLHIACERGAWKCLQHLVNVRSEEIHKLKDEYYPIHHAVLHDIKFLEVLLQNGADPLVRTCTQQMTLIHVVATKSAEDTLATIRLLQPKCKELINAEDSLGNTPLHTLVVRYSLEETHYGTERWTKYDLLTLMTWLLNAGAKHSLNRPGNGAVAYLLRNIRDWDVCYEVLSMLLKHGADPNIVGRDGSAPLLVCLVSLINKDPLHNLSYSMKVCYQNCVRVLLQYGANPNVSYYCNITPLHILVFAIDENMTLDYEERKLENFNFLMDLLNLLLKAGLDCNMRSSSDSTNVLLNIVGMMHRARTDSDLHCVYTCAAALVSGGGREDVLISVLKQLDDTELDVVHTDILRILSLAASRQHVWSALQIAQSSTRRWASTTCTVLKATLLPSLRAACRSVLHNAASWRILQQLTMLPPGLKTYLLDLSIE